MNWSKHDSMSFGDYSKMINNNDIYHEPRRKQFVNNVNWIGEDDDEVDDILLLEIDRNPVQRSASVVAATVHPPLEFDELSWNETSSIFSTNALSKDDSIPTLLKSFLKVEIPETDVIITLVL